MSSPSRRGLGLILDFKKSPPKRKPSATFVHHRHSVSALHAEPFLTTDSTADLASSTAWTDWWKSLLSPSNSTSEEPSSEATSGTLKPSPHKSRFSFLSGDLVLMGGFYGSYLKNATTSIRDWLTLDVLLGFKSTSISLPLDLLLEKNDMKHVADTMLERIGLIDLCSQLVRELKSWEAESGGSFRFDQFAYDWRQDGQTAAQELIECVEKKFLSNGGKPVTIVAHSMGGLIALYALQKRPELFKGIVFCGTPFGPVPLILWGIQKGAPIARACSPEMHFAARSSFLFLPIDGKALVDFKDEDILIDYFKPQEWVDYKLFKRKLSENEQKAQMDHLSNALKKARDLHDTIRRFPVTTHPFVVVTSDRWPTPSRLKCSVKREGLRIMHPCHFVPGDGVVSYENAQMPLGYTFDTICSRSSHPSLMNDLKAMTLALKKIHSPSSSS